MASQQRDEAFMRRCLELARQAREAGEAAVGTVIVQGEAIVAEAEEQTRRRHDPTAHAEVEAVRVAYQHLGKDLSDCTLYTTVEPCFMCAYVIRVARIARVVIGTDAGEVGAVFSKYPILTDAAFTRWASPPEVTAGILGEECRRLLQRISE